MVTVIEIDCDWQTCVLVIG